MKRFTFLCCALLLAGGLYLTSCSDDDDVSGAANQELTDVDSDTADKLSRMLVALSPSSELGKGWAQQTYEVVEGEPVDGNHAVRMIAVSGEEEARSFYQSLTGYLLKQGTTSDTWHCDGLGDLTYTWKGQSDCYATVDISIKQLPGITQMRLVPAAMLAGACAGSVIAFLQTKLQIPSILAGIITNTGLYTVNLAVMGFSSNVNMMKAATVFSMVQPILGKTFCKLIPVAVLTLCVGFLLALFLKTRLGLSIRATGDNPDMVRASSINTSFTITVGLCVSNSLTALSGAVLAQYQKTADINLGTGMVIIGLASLIIGETLMPKGKTWVKILGAVLGSVVYRFIIAIALRMDLPSECLKLISATIVALAIGLPAIKAGLKPATAKGGK